MFLGFLLRGTLFLVSVLAVKVSEPMSMEALKRRKSDTTHTHIQVCVCVGITPVVPTRVYPGLGVLDKSVMPPSIVHTYIQVLQCGNIRRPYILPVFRCIRLKGIPG